MIESTIDQKIAKAIYKANARLIIISMIVGFTIAIFTTYYEVRDFSLVFYFILPITIAVCGIAVYLGVRIGIKRLDGIKFTLDESRLTKKGEIDTVSIPLDTIKRVKKSNNGIIIIGKSKRIGIQKQIEQFDEFEAILTTYPKADS